MKLFSPIFSLAWLAACSLATQAQSPAPQPPVETSPFPARLSDVEGSVRLARTGSPAASSQAIHAAGLNTPVLAGTQVSTGGDGRAEIQFNDGNLARITPNSAIVVVALPSGGEEVRALRGLSYFETGDSGIGSLTVDAGPDAVKLDGASLVRFDLDQPPFKASVLRGTAHFTSVPADTSFDAREGETASIDPAAADSYDVNDDLPEVSWDNWNADRDQTLAELAQSQTEARDGSGDASSPGWNDLDYYGTWYNVPGQGMAWAPDGVDQSFDPYGSGSWGYYSGVGYTWVSSYPWGWLPYHSGAWSYFPGFGWGWQPGSSGGVGWYPYSGVHGGPPNYRVPLPLDGRLRTRLSGAPLPPPVAFQGNVSGSPAGNPIAVNRSPRYGFRPLGGARPEPRPFPIAATAQAGNPVSFAPKVPVIQPGRASYQPGAGFAARAGYQPGRQLGIGQLGNPGARINQGQHLVAPGPNVIPSTPRVLSAPTHAIAPPPQVIVPQPAPVRAAPPPGFTAPAAPTAPSAGPRGH